MTTLGFKYSEESRKRMSIAQMGRKHSEETKQKIRNRVFSMETRRNMSEAAKGRIVSLETRLKIGKAHTGMKRSAETKRKVAEAQKYISLETRMKKRLAQLGSKGSNWKGGVSAINERIRNSFEYKLWRDSVLKRDNYMCTIGGKAHGRKLHADHIKPFSLFPDLRFVLSNGRTLCVDCHKKTDTYGVNTRPCVEI